MDVYAEDTMEGNILPDLHCSSQPETEFIYSYGARNVLASFQRCPFEKEVNDVHSLLPRLTDQSLYLISYPLSIRMSRSAPRKLVTKVSRLSQRVFLRKIYPYRAFLCRTQPSSSCTIGMPLCPDPF